MAIADAGISFQICVLIDRNDIMLWRINYLKQVRQNRMENVSAVISLNVD
jgi:hypothetical protein